METPWLGVEAEHQAEAVAGMTVQPLRAIGLIKTQNYLQNR